MLPRPLFSACLAKSSEAVQLIVTNVPGHHAAALRGGSRITPATPSLRWRRAAR